MHGGPKPDSVKSEMLKPMSLEVPGRTLLDAAESMADPLGAPWLLRGFDRTQTHLMTAAEIDHLVRRGVPGRFVLGYRDARGAFRIQYVGYAAADLNAELKSRIGKSKYFKFRVGPLPAPGHQLPAPPAGA